MSSRILLMAMLVIIGGCVPYSSIYQERFNSLPQQYSQFDLKMAWQTKLTDKATIIDGVVKNIRYYEMNGVEIWASLIDGSGNMIARSASFIMPTALRENDAAPFSLTLGARAEPGMKLLFTYRYSGYDDSDDSQYWMQSFEAPAHNAK